MILSYKDLKYKDNNLTAFMYASILYKSGKIKKIKYIGLLKAIFQTRNPKIILQNMSEWSNTKHYNVYKSSIDNKFFNDTNLCNILKSYAKNVYYGLTPLDVLDCLNLLLSKNRNYCIDVACDHIYDPLIRGLDNPLKIMELRYDYWENFTDYSYCCYDCSGDREEFVNRYMNRWIKDNLKKECKNIIFSQYLR